MRQYSAQSFGLTGQSRWTADASVEESGVVTFSLGTARTKRESKPSALSRLSLRVAALARVRNFHGLATVATPIVSLDNALGRQSPDWLMPAGDC